MIFNLKYITVKIVAIAVCVCFLWQDIVWAGAGDFLRQTQFSQSADNATAGATGEFDSGKAQVQKLSPPSEQEALIIAQIELLEEICAMVDAFLLKKRNVSRNVKIRQKTSFVRGGYAGYRQALLREIKDLAEPLDKWPLDSRKRVRKLLGSLDAELEGYEKLLTWHKASHTALIEVCKSAEGILLKLVDLEIARQMQALCEVKETLQDKKRLGWLSDPDTQNMIEQSILVVATRQGMRRIQGLIQELDKKVEEIRLDRFYRTKIRNVKTVTGITPDGQEVLTLKPQDHPKLGISPKTGSVRIISSKRGPSGWVGVTHSNTETAMRAETHKLEGIDSEKQKIGSEYVVRMLDIISTLRAAIRREAWLPQYKIEEMIASMQEISSQIGTDLIRAHYKRRAGIRIRAALAALTSYAQHKKANPIRMAVIANLNKALDYLQKRTDMDSDMEYRIRRRYASLEWHHRYDKARHEYLMSAINRAQEAVREDLPLAERDYAGASNILSAMLRQLFLKKGKEELWKTNLNKIKYDIPTDKELAGLSWCLNKNVYWGYEYAQPKLLKAVCILLVIRNSIGRKLWQVSKERHKQWLKYIKELPELARLKSQAERNPQQAAQTYIQKCNEGAISPVSGLEGLEPDKIPIGELIEARFKSMQAELTRLNQSCLEQDAPLSEKLSGYYRRATEELNAAKVLIENRGSKPPGAGNHTTAAATGRYGPTQKEYGAKTLAGTFIAGLVSLLPIILLARFDAGLWIGLCAIVGGAFLEQAYQIFTKTRLSRDMKGRILSFTVSTRSVQTFVGNLNVFETISRNMHRRLLNESPAHVRKAVQRRAALSEFFLNLTRHIHPSLRHSLRWFIAKPLGYSFELPFIAITAFSATFLFIHFVSGISAPTSLAIMGLFWLPIAALFNTMPWFKDNRYDISLGSVAMAALSFGMISFLKTVGLSAALFSGFWVGIAGFFVFIITANIYLYKYERISAKTAAQTGAFATAIASFIAFWYLGAIEALIPCGYTLAGSFTASVLLNIFLSKKTIVAPVKPAFISVIFTGIAFLVVLGRGLILAKSLPFAVVIAVMLASIWTGINFFINIWNIEDPGSRVSTESRRQFLRVVLSGIALLCISGNIVTGAKEIKSDAVSETNEEIDKLLTAVDSIFKGMDRKMWVEGTTRVKELTQREKDEDRIRIMRLFCYVAHGRFDEAEVEKNIVLARSDSEDQARQWKVFLGQVKQNLQKDSVLKAIQALSEELTEKYAEKFGPGDTPYALITRNAKEIRVPRKYTFNIDGSDHEDASVEFSAFQLRLAAKRCGVGVNALISIMLIETGTFNKLAVGPDPILPQKGVGQFKDPTGEKAWKRLIYDLRLFLKQMAKDRRAGKTETDDPNVIGQKDWKNLMKITGKKYRPFHPVCAVWTLASHANALLYNLINPRERFAKDRRQRLKFALATHNLGEGFADIALWIAQNATFNAQKNRYTGTDVNTITENVVAELENNPSILYNIIGLSGNEDSATVEKRFAEIGQISEFEDNWGAAKKTVTWLLRNFNYNVTDASQNLQYKLLTANEYGRRAFNYIDILAALDGIAREKEKVIIDIAPSEISDKPASPAPALISRRDMPLHPWGVRAAMPLSRGQATGVTEADAAGTEEAATPERGARTGRQAAAEKPAPSDETTPFADAAAAGARSRAIITALTLAELAYIRALTDTAEAFRIHNNVAAHRRTLRLKARNKELLIIDTDKGHAEQVAFNMANDAGFRFITIMADKNWTDTQIIDIVDKERDNYDYVIAVTQETGIVLAGKGLALQFLSANAMGDGTLKREIRECL